MKLKLQYFGRLMSRLFGNDPDAGEGQEEKQVI